MSEAWKVGDTGHFSEVDTVSSKLFDRVSGPDRLITVSPADGADHLRPVDTSEPFSAIDNVSSHIFDRMEAIERPDQAPAVGLSSDYDAKSSPDDTDRKAGTFLDHPANGNQHGGGHLPEGWVLIPKTAATDLFDRADAEPRSTRPNPDRADITFRAAQRRSQLPDGADPLVGAPAAINEESLLASIRDMMVEQKREFSKKALPELEPVPPASSTSGTAPMVTNGTEQVEEFEDVPEGRIKAALIKFVRTDTVLAICLSVWVSLFLMIFIEPELSQALATISLVLLVIYRLMQPSKKKRRVVRIVNRKRSAHDRALEDALLCQDA